MSLFEYAQIKIHSSIFLFVLLLFLLCAHSVGSSMISGRIYGPDLNQLNDVILSINTTPTQRYVAKQGGYTFRLSKGSYTIEAIYYHNGNPLYYDKTQVVVPEEGDGTYVIDFVLFPIDYEESSIAQELLLNHTDIEFPEIDEDTTKQDKKLHEKDGSIVVIILVITLAAIGLLFIIKNKSQIGKVEHKQTHNKESEIDGNLMDIIKEIQFQGNRTTQKQLRRAFNSSEAKMSLMLTELEHIGYIKKIKRGRGNIIILTEKCLSVMDKKFDQADQKPKQNQARE